MFFLFHVFNRQQALMHNLLRKLNAKRNAKFLTLASGRQHLIRWPANLWKTVIKKKNIKTTTITC